MTKLLPESDLSVKDTVILRERLDQFYSSVKDYTAFLDPSDKENLWQHLYNDIKLKSSKDKKVKILEVGAGRSGFGIWLKKMNLRADVSWTAQDITVQNKQWLKSEAEEVILSDVKQIEGEEVFDIILSTYVLEHVTDPKSHLENLIRLLHRGGSLFIFCPRYDFPGYMCPSSRHLNTWSLLSINWAFLRSRVRTFITNKPAFLIQTDLAAFYRPFFLDADAVHWVSRMDLKLWAKNRGLNFGLLEIPSGKIFSKDWIIKKYLTCGVKISNPG